MLNITFLYSLEKASLCSSGRMELSFIHQVRFKLLVILLPLPTRYCTINHAWLLNKIAFKAWNFDL